MSIRSCRIGLLCLVLLPAGSPAASADEPVKPPEVPVARPVVREITDYEDFTGRVEASKRVEVRQLVTGILLKVAFQEGTEVKKGDLLFEIDPRPYQVELDQALAQVELHKAAPSWPRPPWNAIRRLPNRFPPASPSNSSAWTRRRWTGPLLESKLPKLGQRCTSST